VLNNPLLWLNGLGELSHQLALLDREGTIIECNRAWRALAEQIGPPTADWRKGGNFLRLFASKDCPPATRQDIGAAWTATLEDASTPHTATYLCPLLKPARWFTVTFKQFSANDRAYVLVNHVDVSAAKRREAVRKRQLSASRRTALFAEHTDRAVMILDSKGRIEWVNPGFTKLLGYTLEEVSGRSIDLLEGPDSDPHTAQLVEQKLRAGEGVDVEVLHYTKAGRSLWIRSEIRPVRDSAGDLEHFVALEVDVTDLKLAHDALARDRELLSAIVNGLPHLIAWKSHDLIFRGCNEQYARSAGLTSPEDIIGLRSADLPAVAEWAARAEQIDRHVMETGTAVRGLKETWRTAGGEERIVDVNKMPLRLDDKLISGVLVMSADVTEEERVARKLRENEERWKRALEVNDVGVWDFDVPAGKVVCSVRWHELMQVEATTSIRDFPDFLVHPDDLPRFKVEWNSLLQGTLESLETAIRMRVGEVYHFIKVRARVVERADSGEALRVVGTHVDIHDARQQQLQSANARKLEAIGQLAAGIAHEINTPTQYVGDNVRFLSDAFDTIRSCFRQLERLAESGEPLSGEHLRECLKLADIGYLQQEIPSAISQSLDGIQRIAKIVGAMKEFSHPGQERLPSDLNRAIANTITVATNEWKYVARIETEFDDQMPQVPLIAGEFNQVILNIIVNAAHAIGDALGKDGARTGTIRLATSRCAEWAQICIADDGCGMPPEILERIFDPFFTTKPVGKGTGQGLAIAHNVIVSKHGGTIGVKSQPGHGTTFTIRLPLEMGDLTQVAA
jgi:PAS domain S-box-containing protein